MVSQDALRRWHAFPGKQSRNKAGAGGRCCTERAQALPHGLMPRFIAVKCAGCDLYQVRWRRRAQNIETNSSLRASRSLRTESGPAESVARRTLWFAYVSMPPNLSNMR